MADLSKLERFAKDYPSGSVLFREGDAATEMYVVQRGEVEIVRHSRSEARLVAIVRPGEFFGEMGVINGRTRWATARVRKDSRLLVLDGDTFEAMVRKRVEIAVRLIRTLSDRLEQANSQVELLLLQDTNHRVVACLRQLAEADGVESEEGIGVHIPIALDALAARVTLSTDEVADILQRLAMARLVVHASEVGIEGPGYVIPEVGKLYEFLQFLELKERYGAKDL
jgi:CRP-like cAMP-binding protein